MYGVAYKATFFFYHGVISDWMFMQSNVKGLVSKKGEKNLEGASSMLVKSLESLSKVVNGAFVARWRLYLTWAIPYMLF